MMDVQPLREIRQRHDGLSRALELLQRYREEAALLAPGTCRLDGIDSEIDRLEGDVSRLRRDVRQAGFQICDVQEVDYHVSNFPR